ncbi:hypothetical protein WBW39_17190 [Pectobacterium versatile]|uniref:hypothetical protein n=1 Tax=Pectobacterium versatile TaxID=2488639 RepID=UPI00301873AB
MKDCSPDEAMAELFQADPSYAAELLAEVVRDGNPDELAIMERQLSAASAWNFSWFFDSVLSVYLCL